MGTLKSVRQRRMLTQKELASAIGVSYQTIQAWESGQSRPRPGAQRRLCEVLQITPDELFAVLDATAQAGKERAACSDHAAATPIMHFYA